MSVGFFLVVALLAQASIAAEVGISALSAVSLLKVQLDLLPETSLGRLAALYVKTNYLSADNLPHWLVVSDAPENKLVSTDSVFLIEESVSPSALLAAVEQHALLYPNTLLSVVSNKKVSTLEQMGPSAYASSVISSFQAIDILGKRPEYTSLPFTFIDSLNTILSVPSPNVVLISLETLTDVQKEMFTRHVQEIFTASIIVYTKASMATRSLNKRLLDPSLTLCATDIASCQTLYANCSSQGSCKQKKVRGKECFVCACDKVGTALWTGDKCQYQDISPQFQIIFWVTVGLMVLLLWVVSLLASAGNSSAGDGQAIPGRAKTE